MFEFLGDANTVALIGLIGGILLGLAARVGRFCTLGTIDLYRPSKLQCFGKIKRFLDETT